MSDSKSDGFSTLARANRRTRSTALLRAAAELYVLDRDHDGDQNRRFEELLVHLLPDAGEADRRFVSGRLAGSADAPTAVISMLARDTVEVARPILERSGQLGTFELLTVIAATGPEHHRIIAGRDGLSPQVRQALALSLGDTVAPSPRETDASRCEAEEPKAAIMRLASEAGVGEATGSAGIAAGKMNVSDFLNADRPGRLRLLADLSGRPPLFSDEGLRPPDAGLDQILSAAQVIGYARGWKVEDMIGAVAEGLRLPPESVAASVNDQTGEPLAVLLKAMRLDDATAQQVFLLMSPVGRDVSRFFALAEVYSGMEPYVADTLVAYWRGERPEAGDAEAERGDAAAAELRRTA